MSADVCTRTPDCAAGPAPGRANEEFLRPVTFRELAAADRAVFLNSEELGETVTYTPVDGVAFTVAAVVHRLEAARHHENATETTVRTADVHVSDEDVEDVDLLDTLTFDGLAWSITGFERDGLGMTVIHVMRQQTTKRGTHRTRPL